MKKHILVALVAVSSVAGTLTGWVVSDDTVELHARVRVERATASTEETPQSIEPTIDRWN